MEHYLLEMQDITKYIFNSSGKRIHNTTVKILDSVSFNLKKGEVHALMGENGAGKSTLMKVLSGVLPGDGGKILLDGEEMVFKSSREARAHGIVFVHQELNLCTNIDVAHNFFLGNEPVNGAGLMKKREMYDKCRAAVQSLGFDVDPRTKLGKLSTAQQQIVEIAKALSYDSRIIIMDEPTASLTKKEIDMLFGLIEELKAKGISIIYISHRLDEIYRIGDRMTVLRDGCCEGTIERGEYSEERIIQMMAGRKQENIFMRSHVPDSGTALEVRNLKLGRNTMPLSFYVKRGEVVGLCGLVGAGRTEVARCVFGARRDYGGEVYYQGDVYRKRSPAESIRRGILYLSEDRKSDGLITAACIRENIVLSSLRKLFPKNVIHNKKERRISEQLITEFKVKCRGGEQLISALSGGNQQKVSFAKCYAAKPEILLLDEPTRGIDVNTKFEIYQLIDKAAADGLSVLVISSEMSELIGMSDRIYVMRQGSIAGEVSSREDMTQEKLVSKIIGR